MTMPVPIADSVGYEGTVTEPQWATLIAEAGGRKYGVIGQESWRARIGTADREVRIGPGAGYGWGVVDQTTADASIVLPAATAGSVWHLITVHRDWQNNESAFDSIPGSADRSIPPRDTVPGTSDDQPIWLARIDAGKSQVQELVDLRVWGSNGGAYAADELVLQYLNHLGTSVRIGAILFDRVIDALGSVAWRRIDVTEDTGWVEIRRNGGWQFAWAQVRRVGAIVFFRINATRPGSWSVENNLAEMPQGFRPSVNTYVNSSHGQGGKREFVFQTDGKVNASENGGGVAALTLMGSYIV